MKQEEKELLLQNLCARLPYKPVVHNKFSYREVDGKIKYKEIDKKLEINDFYSIWNIKPYLRPMSSMTKEECRELQELCDMYDPYHDTDPYDDWGIYVLTQHVHSDVPKTVLTNFGLVLDWLNAHHFDYRGLIDKGLALPAPEGMYNN